ncbi:NAD(P)H-dependent oxidoreductase [Actinokineospora auranticolor]|uniref:Multimeric flavodoxin WrbA n=1 Tax=Actinokineospora auranticolor TaxID=155976 RepID=A0A2S6GCN9_9PSEU|nr:NAD(P)H-dependent oxidoreductase [Actinokineospora auranticolor]PPK62752.1 multimeric flavodoxin WrbA [Actinokineospora auranticolor]
MSRFLFVLGSSRRDGNTEQLARHAARALPADVERQWLWLGDHPLPTFADTRHDNPLPPPTGNEKLLLDATLAATDIVIASPLYWYTVSNSTKAYLDYWSNWLRVREADFKARMAPKTLWGVTALAEDTSQAEALEGMLRRSAEYLRMRWAGVLLGNGSKPGDIRNDTEALTRAETFFLPARV